MSAHALEAALVHGVAGAARRMPWHTSLGVGARLGELVGRLGIRRSVAEDNLLRAFPEWDPAERRRVLDEHYRELGRIAIEYPRLPELSHAAPGEVVAEIRGFDGVLAATERGRGVIFLTGHIGNFELMGAVVGQRHPLDFVVRRLSNPHVERWVDGLRRSAGVGVLHADLHVRRIFEALAAHRWVAMLADQDARSGGLFVPFLGRPASTSPGPARIALATGAPIIMTYGVRGEDGRHHLEFDPPLDLPDPGLSKAEAVADLTQRHAARLEQWVRRYPEHWFWLHRRWKTQPRATGGD